MALVTVAGRGLYIPSYDISSIPTFAALGPIDAAGEKAAFVGRVWFPARTGTKDIRYVCFRFGSVTKTGGSTLIASLQDVTLTTGAPGQPDETTDQHVHIANEDAAFASNTWYKTGALNADRTVTYGDRLAFVVEYDSFGAGDIFNLSCPGLGTNYRFSGESLAVKKTGAGPTWSATTTLLPNVVFECSDGSFATLESSYVVSAINTHTVNLGSSTADEYALNFQVPFPCKVDALWALAGPAAGTGDFEVILYSGTTPLATVTVDGNTFQGTTPISTVYPITPVSLSKDTLYRVSVRPTVTATAGNVYIYSIDVADANHFTVHDGGINMQYSTRLDQGAWSAATATRRLVAGVRICELDDGVSAGGGLLTHPGMSGGLRG